MISDDEEISRIVPVITAVKNNFDIPVSVDTYKSAVAKEAILAGADLVNDIWGFKYDNKIAKITAEYNKTCCLMHNRKEAVYNDFMSDVLSDLEESIKIALDAGVKKENIMLDPGVGFAKNYEQNLEITNKCEQLLTLGYPVLLGTSRKSMIGLTLDLPANQRVEGTLATSVLAVIKNLMFVRVHDVLENKRIITMTEKILGKF
jgi:dihydropteroate synthase